MKEDKKFTPQIGRELAENMNLPHHPRVISDDADIFVKSLKKPLNSIESNLPTDAVEVINEKMFLMSFFDFYENLSSSENKSIPAKGEEFLSIFENWKSEQQNKFMDNIGFGSYQMAFEKISRINIHDTVLYADQRYRYFSRMYNSQGNFETDYIVYNSNMEKWNCLHTISFYAEIIANKRRKPKK